MLQLMIFQMLTSHTELEYKLVFTFQKPLREKRGAAYRESKRTGKHLQRKASRSLNVVHAPYVVQATQELDLHHGRVHRVGNKSAHDQNRKLGRRSTISAM